MRVQNKACGALFRLGHSSSAIAAMMVQLGAMERVFTALDTYIHSTGLVIDALAALGSLCHSDNSDACKKFVSSGGLSHIWKAMEAHNDVLLIHEQACRILLSLLVNDASRVVVLADTKGVPTVKHSKAAFPDSEVITELINEYMILSAYA